MGGVRVALVAGIGVMLSYDSYILAAHHDSFTQTFLLQGGVASWYGREEQGKLTASGEHFNRHKFTAASRRLPLNTVVRVTNETNGRSVRVRINDRGPFIHDRILDLSEAAAETLGMKESGTAPVKIELVEPAPAIVP